MFAELRTALSYCTRTGAITHTDDKTDATRRGQYGYYIVFGRRCMPADKVALWLATGVYPKQVYHLNGDKFDNRRYNLRSVTPEEARELDKQREEEAKREAARKRQSLPRGVIQCRDTGLYYARVLVRGQIKVSPRCDTAAQARVLRDAMLTP